jgi:hypothetical protein
MSDRTQTPEAPEPERKPAVALDPAPAAPAAPVGGLALGQLGSVDAVLALQQSSGNQAVDRVLRGQAGTGEATLPGALGAALVAARPAAAKRAAGKRADSVGSQVATAGIRSQPDPDFTRSLASRADKDNAAVGAGPATATAVGLFGGAGFVDPAGLDAGAATYGGAGGATRDRWIAAAAGAAGDEGSGTDGGDAGSGGADAGTTDMGDDATGAGDGGDIGDDEPGEGDEPWHGSGAADADADGDGAAGWADTGLDSDADRAASEAMRENWARRQREHTPAQPRSAELPGPSVDDTVDRRRHVEAFREMAGAGLAENSGAERNVATATVAIDEKDAARARNEATRAQLLAWASRQGDAGETRGTAET